MPRNKIINMYAEWTSFSSTRSGSPLKSRADIYPLIRAPRYSPIFNGAKITQDEFDQWHQENCELVSSKSIMPIGWSAKLINVYLKTRVYVAKEGRENLINVIHPPIDGGVWDGIEIYCTQNKLNHILENTHTVRKIKDIQDYVTYKKIITGCKDLSKSLNCNLIEVEQLWLGTEF